MRNENELQDIYADCLYDLVSIGLNPIISEISLNKRLRKAYGRCFVLSKEIEINYDYYSYSELYQLKNTIIHEILHAMCNPNVDHGKDWLDLCDIVNNGNLPYGKIKQYGDKNNYKEMSPNYKYTIYCPNCGKEYHYKSKNKMITNPQNYWDRDCGKEHRLKLKENIDKLN